MLYLLRKIIRRLPGTVIKAVPLPDPETIEGHGKREEAGTLCRKAGYTRILLVTDKTLFSLGLHEKVLRSLEDAGVGYSVFSDISSEPDLKIIDGGRKALAEAGADAVIALGGGAVLDSCKMIAAGGRLRRRKSKSLLRKFLFVPHKTLPILAIPTTAGTGAEITVGAVVTNDGGKKIASVVVGLDVFGVILDSELTENAPRGITCACGIDALSHGLEGAVASVHVSDDDVRKSRECVKTVLEKLPILLGDPQNREARQAMCLAAHYGGNAINRQLAGYVHAFAHSIGAAYHIPHGNAIALCLLPVMRLQKDRCLVRLASLSRYCGLCDDAVPDNDAAERLFGAVEELIGQCGLGSVRVPIPKEDYRRIAHAVAWDSINYSPPVTLNNRQIYQILDQINEK